MDVTDPLLHPNFKLLVSDDSDSDSADEASKRRSNKSRSSSSKKKKSKHSRHHKSKSKKKHKKRSRQSSSSSSEEQSKSESEEDAWVEKQPAPAVDKANISASEQVKAFKKPPTSEDMDLFNLIPTYSNDSKKQRRVDEKRSARELSSIDQVGLHERELNPYWKNGGTGLPSEIDQGESPAIDKDKKPSVSTPVGDGGLSWLKKSYQRAKEQAKDEGRSLEEVAAERWGSLNNFFSMLEEAERKASSVGHRGSDRRERERDNRRHKSFKRPDRDSDEEPHSTKFDSSSRSYAGPSRRRGWKKEGGEASHKDIVEQSRRERTPEPEELKRRSRSRSPFSPPKVEVEVVKEDSDSDSKEQEEDEPEKKVLTDQEMNALNAKIIKAELLSNTVLVEQLKSQLEQAKKDREEFIKSGGKPNSNEKRVVTKVIMDTNQGGRRKKDKPTETHKDGQRVRYFPDDDRQSLANMFQKEKMNTVEDENALFSRLAGQKMKPTEDYDLDDIFADKASSSKSVRKEQERDIRKVVDEEKQYQRTLGDCNWCFEGKMQKNIVISIGEKSFLCVPPFQSLTDGHCLIVPMFHSCSSTALDEDVWAEIQKFRQAVVKMFSDADQDVVIFERAVYLKSHPHMYIECVPMPKEIGELAPIYFKKAIQECETEWSQNKKLVDLRGKDIRRGVPKGLPYFWVDFGLDSGFAHVIEDEKYFPKNFAQEIIGGMMELDHHLWRKQKLDDFNAQKNKVMEFLKMWGPYDWTR